MVKEVTGLVPVQDDILDESLCSTVYSVANSATAVFGPRTIWF